MGYKVSELADKAGVTKRTIHYYISKGLLMPPKGNGVNSIYDDDHLKRIFLIKRLQAEYMPLNKIREYILENQLEAESNAEKKFETKSISVVDTKMYIRENVCDIFEIHYSKENGEKYRHIIENVKKYVEKMMED